MKLSLLLDHLRLLLLCFILTSTVCQANDPIFTPIKAHDGLSDNQIRYILQLPDGRMVFTTNGNVNIYDGTHFDYIHRSDRDIYALSAYDGFYRIYQSVDSLLWIKDQNKLMCIDLRFETYIADLDNIFFKIGITHRVMDLFLDHDQQLWLLTEQGLIQPNDSLIISDVNKYGRLQDVGSDGGRLYLFYSSGIVACFDLKSLKELYHVEAYSASDISKYERTSLLVKSPAGFYQLRNGSRGGFFYFDPESKTWEAILETDYTLNTLIVTPDNLAFITCAKGIWKIDLVSGERQYYPSLQVDDGTTVSTHISTIFQDQQGALWIGTYNRGLLYHHPSRFAFQKFNQTNFHEKSQDDFNVEAFQEDTEGNIYVKSGSNYFLMDINASQKLLPVVSNQLPTDIADHFKENNRNHQFQGKWYTDVISDSRSWVWAGTSDGLHLFTHDSAISRIFYTEDGLINNYIHAIIEDKQHNIWVTTSNGITRISIDTAGFHFTNFNTKDGTIANEYLDGSVFESSNGSLFFGGIDGFNMLMNQSLLSPRLHLRPVLRAVWLRGEELKCGIKYDEKVLMPKAASFTRSFIFSYFQNFLTFDYVAPYYLNQDQVLYKYRLEGSKDDWIEVQPDLMSGGLLSINYSNLAPGSYVLKVMATNNPNNWEVAVSELIITILPPWWKTKTAYFLFLIFTSALASLMIYFYTRYTREKLEQKHREELLLIRIRNLIEQRNSFEQGQDQMILEDKSVLPESHEENVQSPTDIDFLNRAMELVEKNLNSSEYSVEQLSRDLCMERTGLYKKLINLLDESPSLFIRNIRLRRAAELILEGNLSIGQIAFRVGFSSASYMSKCFQEVYGCKPSEYAAHQHKST